MNVNTRFFALAVMPVLGLLASVALADVSGLPLPTPDSGEVEGVQPTPGEIKNRNQCDGATFFKNVFPSLTNGSPGGSDFIDFNVEGENVRVTVTWYPDNSFDFVTDGYVKKMAVTVDTNNFIYDYTGPPLTLKGISDTQLNFYGEGLTADDVNHLDLCLETLDSDAPEVAIRVEPSSDGTTVSGEISIIATVTDESELDSVTIEIVSTDGSVTVDPALIVGPTVLECDPAEPGCYEYTWTLDTGEVPVGDYIIRVGATVTSILANFVEEEKNITVVRSLLNCLNNTDGTLGVPPGEASSGGCKITEAVQLEYPGELEPYVGALEVSQAYIPARTDIDVSSPFCDTGTYPLIAHDPRISPSDGKTYVGAARTQDLADLFAIQDHYDEFHGGMTADSAELSAEVVGSPCLALVHQDAPDFFDIAGLLPPDFTYSEGPIYTVTQFPNAVPGMYDDAPRYTAPLNYCDPATDANCESIPECFISTNPDAVCAQKDPQNVEQAAYQPDDQNDLVLPFAQALTNDFYNPARTAGFKGSYWPINTREVCPDIPIQEPATPEYIEAVYQCKIDLALRYEADTEQALVEADALGSLISPSLNNLLNWLNRAQSQIKNSHFERCVSNLERLESDVINGVWNDVLDPVDSESRNDQGRVLTYVKNLTWRCEQLLLTETYLDSLP